MILMLKLENKNLKMDTEPYLHDYNSSNLKEK